MPCYYKTKITDYKVCHVIVIYRLLALNCVKLLLYTNYLPQSVLCYCYIIQIVGPNLCQAILLYTNYWPSIFAMILLYANYGPYSVSCYWYIQITGPKFCKGIIIHNLLTLNFVNWTILECFANWRSALNKRGSCLELHL